MIPNRLPLLSIRVHLIFLLFLLSIPFVFFAIYSGITERNEAIRNAKNQSLKFVGIIAGEQQSLVAGVEQLVTALSFVPELRSRNVAATNSLLVDLLKKNPQFTNIAVMDMTGRVWGSAAPFQGRVSLGDRRYFREAVRTGRFSSGEFTIGRISGKPIMNFGYPVKGRSGRMVAVIGAAFDLEYIQHNFEKMDLPMGSSFSVLDHNGTILYRDRQGARSQGRSEKRETGMEIFGKMREGPEEGTFDAVGEDGVLQMFAYRKIVLTNESGPSLYIRASIPRSAAISHVNAAMIQSLAVWMVFFLGGLLLAWFVGKRFIVDPVRVLGKASHEIAVGAEAVHVSALVQGGELGELARAFDHMAEALVQRERAKNVAESTLRESEGKFKDLAEKSPVGITLVQDGVVQYANERCAEMIEYGVDEIIYRITLQEIIFADDLPLVEDKVRAHLSGEAKSAQYELRIRTRTGAMRNVEVYSAATLYRGRPAIIGTVLDITERKQMEKALHESEEKYRLLADNSSDVIWTMNLNGCFTYLSPSVRELTDFTPEEAMTIPLDRHVVKEDLPWVMEMISRELVKPREERLDRTTVELRQYKKDGSAIDLEISTRWLFDEQGEIVGLQGSSRSISARKKMEEARAKLEAQLRQAQKLEAIGTLAGGIAHDFNNILSAIIGYTELYREQVQDRPKVYGGMEQVLIAANRAKELIRQILTFSRRTEQEQKPIALTPLVKEVAKFMRASLPASVEVRQAVHAASDVIMGDATQIHQVLMNLCTNAGQAMKTGGVLEILLDDVALDSDEVRSFGLESGHYLRLTVRDTGPGIPPEHLERIFEPYFSTKGKSEGTGLGLSVADGIVKSHRGAIRVYSELGKGSVFILYLPLVAERAEIQKTETKTWTGGKERILFVDDEQALAELGGLFLQDLGYRVVTETEPDRAMARFREDRNAFDLVITDKSMPHMTGFDLAQGIKETRPDIPIILCSGFQDKEDLDKLLRFGISRLLAKPISMAELAGAVRDALDRRSETHPPP